MKRSKKRRNHQKIANNYLGMAAIAIVVLILLALVSANAYPLLPVSPSPLERAKLFFHMVDDLGKSFLFMNVIGAVLCVVRKMGTR